ncbi:MAG TPA: hypothetical protein VJJ28_02895 [Candidatus Paceibacterota bacterium]
MKEIIKNILKLAHLYIPLCNLHNKNVRKAFHRTKQLPLHEFRKRFKPRIFVETGTYKGEMVEAMRRKFKKIYTIELADGLYEKARVKFAKYPHIHLFHGDSQQILPKILKEINEPTLFWIDAHWSGGETTFINAHSPVQYELQFILDHHIKNHVILIDDVRNFVGIDGYPKSSAIEQMAKSYGYEFENKDDIFRLYPRVSR